MAREISWCHGVQIPEKGSNTNESVSLTKRAHQIGNYGLQNKYYWQNLAALEEKIINNKHFLIPYTTARKTPNIHKVKYFTK